MKDLTTNQAFLYGHMREASSLSIGDSVTFGTYVGHEGTTGNSTGIHLHLEQEDLGSSMVYQYGLPIEQMIDPSIYLGIPNTQGISAIYNGTPIFPVRKKKRHFPWVIYANKIRKRNNLL